MAVYWPTPGYKGRTFKLCVLTRWDFNFCIRSSPLRGFNTAMSKVQQSVEWEFGKVVRLWTFLNFEKNLKLFLSPVGKLYMVGVLLTNCHTSSWQCDISVLWPESTNLGGVPVLRLGDSCPNAEMSVQFSKGHISWWQRQLCVYNVILDLGNVSHTSSPKVLYIDRLRRSKQNIWCATFIWKKRRKKYKSDYLTLFVMHPFQFVKSKMVVSCASVSYFYVCNTCISHWWQMWSSHL